MKFEMRSTLASSVALCTALAFPVCTAASAQETASSTGGDASSAGPGEIIVTAQKTSTTLQKAPAAISVMTGADLTAQGISDIRTVQYSIPSVRFNRNQDKAQLYIRGIGIATDNIGLDAGVAFNFAEAILPREGTGSALFDVDRIEVLKGPQGTTYGANAAGGVINLSPTKPANNWDGYVNFEYADYDTKHLTAAQNIPVSDVFQLRVAGDVNYHDGYASNGYDDQKTKAIRVSALLEPVPTFSAYVWSQYYTSDGKGDYAYALPFTNPNDPWVQGFDPALLQVFSPDQRTEGRRNRFFAMGANITAEIGNFAITYIPAFMNVVNRGSLIADTAGTNLSQQYISTSTTRSQWTHELRLSNANPSDRLKWLFGLYAFTSDNTALQTQGRNKILFIPEQHNWNVAGFAQGIYAVTPSLRVTAGMRYARDHKDANGSRFGAAPAFTPIPFTASFTKSRFDWKVGADFDVAPDSLLYATVQTGSLGAGLSYFTSTTIPNVVEPEKVLAFQLGTKNRFFDRRFTLNAEAYYYDYKNYQVSLRNFAANTTTVFNAPKSRIFGLEIDSKLAVGSGGQLSVAAGYLNAKFTDFVVPIGVSSAVRGYNFNDYDLPWAPRWTVSVGYRHVFELGGENKLTFNAQSQYSSSFWTTFSHGIVACATVPTATLTQDQCVNYNQRQRSYTNSNIDITLAVGSNIEIAAFVRNIEDEPVIASGAEGGLTATGARNTFPLGQLHPPRIFGARLGVKW